MAKMKIFTPLNRYNAERQAVLAVALLSVIPALAFFYLGTRISAIDTDSFRYYEAIIVFFCTLLAVFSAYLMIRNHSRSIFKLRKYITELSDGTLREKIHLDHAEISDDLSYIEGGFNAVLQEITTQLQIIEGKYTTEVELRKTLQKQQKMLIAAEQHRVMVQSIGAACHHLGQPTTILKMRLFLLKSQAHSLREMENIQQSIDDLEQICEVLRRLREVNEFRTEPYIDGDEYEDQLILAI